MTLSPLTAISPIDGRYRSKTESLTGYFSEFALMHYRVRVEVEYFMALCALGLKPLPALTDRQKLGLRAIYSGFNEANAEKIKLTERTTNHDVKAVEYFVKEQFQVLGLGDYAEFVHFGLTSQDINNTAIPLSIKEGLNDCVMPSMEKLILAIHQTALHLVGGCMLAHTHGQPASPTTMGKELMVFYERLRKQMDLLINIPIEAKLGGATGNFNAHLAAYPEVDWKIFADNFTKHLGLTRQQYTTQIEHYDSMARLFDTMRRFNVILVDFSRDVWQYISMNYFKQKVVANEVGSSAMPHKVNPIDFENAEGNLLLANAIFDFMSNKLPVSRLQRDLTDSTVLRNIGVPFAHSIIAYQSLVKGINKLIPNLEEMGKDLEENWAVIAEAIQTILRRELYPKPYEALKELTRTGHRITREGLVDFIDKLEISETVKDELKKLSPHNYVGYGFSL